MCSKCNKVLAEFDEDTRKSWLIADCEHFKWERISALCYYDAELYEVCDAKYVEQLKKKSLVRIDDGEHFLLLVPKGEEE
jgi:hypothetical protein